MGMYIFDHAKYLYEIIKWCFDTGGGLWILKYRTIKYTLTVAVWGSSTEDFLVHFEVYTQ